MIHGLERYPGEGNGYSLQHYGLENSMDYIVHGVTLHKLVLIAIYFFKCSCFFDDPTDVGNLLSDSSDFSKSSLNFWKFTIHILLKPGLENFEDYFATV